MANQGTNNTQNRVQELVAKYKTLRNENEKLKTQLLASRQLQRQLEEKNQYLQQQLSNALLLKSLMISEGDKATAKKAIQSMIKEVDRCIHYLYR